MKKVLEKAMAAEKKVTIGMVGGNTVRGFVMSFMDDDIVIIGYSNGNVASYVDISHICYVQF